MAGGSARTWEVNRLGSVEAAYDLLGGLAGGDQTQGLLISLSVIWRGRPPTILASFRHWAIESVTRSRLIWCSISASVAMIVHSMDPLGVDGSTFSPPRFSTRRSPAPRARNSSAKAASSGWSGQVDLIRW